MDLRDGFEELTVDEQHSEIKIPIMHLEVSLNVKYFINKSGVGYCELLIKDVRGKGLRGKIEASVARAYVGKQIFVFLSELQNGKTLITVPILLDGKKIVNMKADFENFIVNMYHNADFKRKPQEIYEKHIGALMGEKIYHEKDLLIRSILELPKKGVETMVSIKFLC